MLQGSDPSNVVSIRERLAREQENRAHRVTVVYRLYTEYKPGIPALVSRYFTGATILDAIGLWDGSTELACVIEIVGTHADLQAIAHLVGDIKVRNNQSSVLVTRQRVDILPIG